MLRLLLALLALHATSLCIPVATGLAPPRQNFQVNTPTRFKINGNLAGIVLSSLTLALRAGSSALVGGYSVKLEPSEGKEDKYSILQAAGYRVSESGLTRTRRPKKMLELYEFEGCPFCKKVRALSHLPYNPNRLNPNPTSKPKP